MKIGIDARFLTHPQKGGFNTYTENLVSALAEVDSENQYILYLDRQPDQYSKIPNKANFTHRVVPSKIPMLGMLWREQVLLPLQANIDKLDLIHSPCLSAPLYIGCTSIITIHDVIWLSPNKFSGGKNRPRSINRNLQESYYRHIPKLAVNKASSIITVSEYSKEEIVRYLGLSSENIFVTYEAASCNYMIIDDNHKIKAIREKYDLSSDFILAIGSADPRKNITTLLQAYTLLPNTILEQFQLAIVWTHSFLSSTIELQVDRLGLNNRVRFLEWVSDEDLVLLYNAAELFVFPSQYEGFGLPLVEAMACGTPIVASNNSSIPEVVGGAAILVDENNAAEIAGNIAMVISDKAVHTRMSKKGIHRAASFSWENCARQTVEIYKQAYEKRSTK